MGEMPSSSCAHSGGSFICSSIVMEAVWISSLKSASLSARAGTNSCSGVLTQSVQRLNFAGNIRIHLDGKKAKAEKQTVSKISRLHRERLPYESRRTDRKVLSRSKTNGVFIPAASTGVPPVLKNTLLINNFPHCFFKIGSICVADSIG